MSATYIPVEPAAEIDIRCPDCGGELTIEPRCEISEPVAVRNVVASRTDINGVVTHPEMSRRTRIAPAALCNSCEFCVEIRHS
jgi:hypothetical protein